MPSPTVMASLSSTKAGAWKIDHVDQTRSAAAAAPSGAGASHAPMPGVVVSILTLRWRPGVSVVHCSGVTEVDALSAARDQGANIGGFHPMQTFGLARSIAVRAVAEAGAVEAGLARTRGTL